jgi:hypothetical protein
MIEYCIIYRSSSTGLSDAVNQLMKSGWKPQGGVAVCGGPMYAGCYQTMIKVTKEVSRGEDW